LGIARAGNVIGGGDWAKDRIVPDCMQAWSKGDVVQIRNPKSTRPWQHVLEPLSGYLMLAVALTEETGLHGEAYNFGPSDDLNHPVSDLIDEMSQYWENVAWNDVSKNNEDLHEAGLLKLNCDKALSDLKWVPTLKFSETVSMTVEWYKEYYQKRETGSHFSMQGRTIKQIDEYTQLAKKRRIFWAQI
jgi:CDP-glucose 4,6-dehydratase